MNARNLRRSNVPADAGVAVAALLSVHSNFQENASSPAEPRSPPSREQGGEDMEGFLASGIGLSPPGHTRERNPLAHRLAGVAIPGSPTHSPRASVSHRISVSGRSPLELPRADAGGSDPDLARAVELLEKHSRDRNPLAHRFGGSIPMGFPARSPRTSISRHTSISTRVPVEMMRTGVAVDESDLNRAVESLERRARQVSERQRRIKEEEQALAARERALVGQPSQESLVVTAVSSSWGLGRRESVSSRGSSQAELSEQLASLRGTSRPNHGFSPGSSRRRTPVAAPAAGGLDLPVAGDGLHAARLAGVLGPERAVPIWQAPELEELIRQKRVALDAAMAPPPPLPPPQEAELSLPPHAPHASLVARRGLAALPKLRDLASSELGQPGSRNPLRRLSYDSALSRLAPAFGGGAPGVPSLPLAGFGLEGGQLSPWDSSDGDSPSPPSRQSAHVAESPRRQRRGAETPMFGKYDKQPGGGADGAVNRGDAGGSKMKGSGAEEARKAAGGVADGSGRQSDSPSPDGRDLRSALTDRGRTPPQRGQRYQSMDGQARTPPLMPQRSRDLVATGATTVRGTADTRAATPLERGVTPKGGTAPHATKEGGRMVPVPVHECVRVLCGEVRRLKDELEAMEVREAREIEEGKADITKQAEKSIRAATELADELQVSINILSEGPKWSLAWSREMDGTKARLQAEMQEIADRHTQESARLKKLKRDRDLWNPEELARLEGQLALTRAKIQELEEELSQKQWEVAELVAASEAARQNVATAKEKYGTVKLTYIRAMEDLKEATEDISDITRKVSGLTKKNRKMHLVSVMRNAGIAMKAPQAAEQPSLLVQWQQQAAAAASGNGAAGSASSSPPHPEGRRDKEGRPASGAGGGGPSDQPLGRARFITWSDRIRASEQRKRVLEEKLAKMRVRVSTAKKELASVNEALAKAGLAEGGGLGQLVREKDAAAAERDRYQRRYREALARIVAVQQQNLRMHVQEEWKQGLEEGIGVASAQGWGPGLRRLPGEKPEAGTLVVWWPEDEDASPTDAGTGYIRDPPDGWDENLFSWSDLSDSDVESLLRKAINS